MLKKIINRELKTGLQKKFLIILIFFILIPFLILAVYSYQISKNIIQNKINHSMLETLSQIKYSIENLASELGSASNVISQDTDVLDILNKKDYSTYKEQITDEIKMENILNNVKRNIFSMNAEIIVIGLNGQVHTTYSTGRYEYESLCDKVWFKEILEKEAYYHWFQFNKNDIGLYSDSKTIAMGRLVIGSDSIVIVLMEEQDLRNIISSIELESNRIRIIMDEGGNVISHTETDLVNKRLFIKEELLPVLEGENGYRTLEIDNTTFHVNYETISYTKWRIVELLPHKWLFGEISYLQRSMIFMIVIIFAIFAVMAYFIIYRFILPIKILQKLMKRVEEGDLNTSFNLDLNDEIGMLGKSFNSMVNNLRQLIEENYRKQQEIHEKEKTREQLKYRVLQSQINPHFLFNTLNSIKWMAVISNAPNVANNIASLGGLLEASIKRVDDEITVHEELDYLKKYIQIMQSIHANKFDVQFDIDGSILNLSILKLLIQPIVENSLIHGISKMSGNGKISISGCKENYILVIEVKDNGVGMDKELIERLLTEDMQKDSRRFNSLGFYSINQRIKVNYGNQYGLTIKSEQNKGTKVTICLPVIGGDNSNV